MAHVDDNDSDDDNDNDSDDDALLDYASVGHITNLGPGTLRWLVHERRIPHVRLGARIVRFERRAIERWLAARRVPERPDPARGGRMRRVADGSHGSRSTNAIAVANESGSGRTRSSEHPQPIPTTQRVANRGRP